MDGLGELWLGEMQCGAGTGGAEGLRVYIYVCMYIYRKKREKAKGQNKNKLYVDYSFTINTRACLEQVGFLGWAI